MGVIACKHSALQVELVHHQEIVKRFKSVRYLHVICCFYNTAADVLATEALDTKTKSMLTREGRYEDLRKLNRIQEKLVGDDKPV